MKAIVIPKESNHYSNENNRQLIILQGKILETLCFHRSAGRVFQNLLMKKEAEQKRKPA